MAVARNTLTLSMLVVLLTGGILRAGPLNPPAGVVAGTFKTLAEVEPRIAVGAANTPGDPLGDPSPSLFKITQPGSYYLTGNITGVVGKHGIEIAASGVTLDLNGYGLVGVPGMGAFDGVSVTVAGLTDIVVVNGSVRDWGDEGVDLSSVSTTNTRVESVVASGNGGTGINVGFGCTMSNCSVNSNGGSGIGAFSGCTISNCSANSNSGTGITVVNGCTISNCSVYLNSSNGIVVAGGCTVSSCSVYSNGGDGISANIGNMVADCTVRLNTLDGIQCTSGCIIRGNSCSGNGNGAGDGAGIHAISIDNRIEGNICIGADRGIDVDSAGGIITRNTCTGNTTNWDVVAGNVCLVVQGAVGGAAILGNTGGVAPGSTDPNANFTY